MAGSLDHVLHGWDLIENMGDAEEAVEEMLWLILRTMPAHEAKRLLREEYYPMSAGRIAQDPAFVRVQKLMRPSY